MMRLTIEGLKDKYSEIADVLMDAGCCQEDAPMCALNELCRMILCTTTTYEGMSMQQLMMNIESDMRYIRGRMSEQEEERHIHYHWDLIEQRDKELQEFMKQQKQ